MRATLPAIRWLSPDTFAISGNLLVPMIGFVFAVINLNDDVFLQLLSTVGVGAEL